DADAGTLAPVMGRTVRPEGAQALADAPSTEPNLIEQVQQLALDAAREDVPAADVALDLERLSTQAQLADHAALVSTVAQARAALDRAEDEGARAEVRSRVSEALNHFAADQAEPPAAEPPAAEPSVIGAPAPTAPAATGDGADDEMLEVF